MATLASTSHDDNLINLDEEEDSRSGTMSVPDSTDVSIIGADQMALIQTEEGCLKKFRRLVTVEPLLFLYFVAFVPLIPVTEQYVYKQVSDWYGFIPNQEKKHTCNLNSSDPEYILQQQVEAKSSEWMVVFNVCSMFPAVFSVGLLGPYSDVAGRKIAMILPIIGGIIRAFFSIIIVYCKLDFRLMLIPNFVEGCTGGIVAFLMSCFAYIADISDHKQRSIRILILDIMIGFGVAISQVSIGYIIKAVGYVYPFLYVEIFHVINLFLVFFYIKETVHITPNGKLFNKNNYNKVIQIFTKDNETKRRWKLCIALLILLIVGIVDIGMFDVMTLLMLNSPLCFSSVLIGYYIAELFVLKELGSLLFAKIFHSSLGDVGCMIVGCITGMAGQIFVMFATTMLMIFLSKYSL